MRVLVAIATAAVLLLGVAAPHHHAAPGGAHECVACTVGTGEEARDATPVLAPPAVCVAPAAPLPGASPVTGAPLGAVPGQSPPA
ncbi:MAG TPA: hypothetical protein VFM53_04195 [Anaeromyxobacteraceae bacterium]|nr:hypothetical protein [Anaeromyxobacteraceae bacterium]